MRVHQVYATHCTYGSSAIERREGELSGRVLGYSARASSLPRDLLRKHIRTLERYLSYQLPVDSPAELKVQWTPSTAPKRLVFIASSAGIQMLAHVAYRQRDMADRAGSYFAHILMAERRELDPVWPITDCLKLWGNPAWVEEDDASIPYDLPSFSSLEEFAAGQPPFIDDRRFLSFLREDKPAGFPEGVVGFHRWCSMSPIDRQRLFATALQGYLQTAVGDRESMLLVVEPEVAVVLFYGIARMLPEGPIRDRLSFSTYESYTERLVTGIAATHFCHPESTDLKPDRFSKGFVLNTFKNTMSATRDLERPYVQLLTEHLLTGGWTAVDSALATLRSAGAHEISELHQLARVDDVALAILSARDPIPQTGWSDSPLAVQYLRNRLTAKFASKEPSAEEIRDLAASADHLFATLRLLCTPDCPPKCQSFVRQLLNSLPEEVFPALLEQNLPVALCEEALATYIQRHHQLPATLEGFWSPHAIAASGEPATDFVPNTLRARLLSRLDAKTLDSLLQGLQGDERSCFLVTVAHAAATAEEIDHWLAQHIRLSDPPDFQRLMRRLRSFAWPRTKRFSRDFFVRLHGRIQNLQKHPETIKQEVEELQPFSHGMDGPFRERLEAWRSIVSHIESAAAQLKEEATGTRTRRRKKPLDRNRIGEQVAAQVACALGKKTLRSSDDTTKLVQILRNLNEFLSPGVNVFPEEFERKLELYLEYGSWDDALTSRYLSFNKPQIRSSRKSLWALCICGGIVFAIATWAIIAKWSGSSERKTAVAVVQPIDEAVPANPLSTAQPPPEQPPIQPPLPHAGAQITKAPSLSTGTSQGPLDETEPVTPAISAPANHGPQAAAAADPTTEAPANSRAMAENVPLQQEDRDPHLERHSNATSTSPVGVSNSGSALKSVVVSQPVKTSNEYTLICSDLNVVALTLITDQEGSGIRVDEGHEEGRNRRWDVRKGNKTRIAHFKHFNNELRLYVEKKHTADVTVLKRQVLKLKQKDGETTFHALSMLKTRPASLIQLPANEESDEAVYKLQGLDEEGADVWFGDITLTIGAVGFSWRSKPDTKLMAIGKPLLIQSGTGQDKATVKFSRDESEPGSYFLLSITTDLLAGVPRTPIFSTTVYRVLTHDGYEIIVPVVRYGDAP